MKKTRCLAVLCLLALAPALRAAEAPTSPTPTPATVKDTTPSDFCYLTDLCQNLHAPEICYIHASSKVPATTLRLKYVRGGFLGPIILDLRYFTDSKFADSWLDGISAIGKPGQPVLLLVSPETSRVILAALAPGVRDCITIGRAAPGFHTDIVVDVTAENDHAAWLVTGRRNVDALQKLITPVIDKPRNDEAALAKEHAADLAGTDNSDSSADDSTTDAPNAKASTSNPKSAPLIDAVLLRAVQINRGLLALKKT